MNTNISSQLEAIRDRLDDADNSSNTIGQIGDILIALGQITDLLEQTNKRIDALDDR